MFHHDLALTGFTPAKAPDTNHILWTYDTELDVQSSPAVVGDKVYIGSASANGLAPAGKVFCLDKYTGALVWSYDAGNRVRSSPAVADGRVFFLSEDGTFYAVNAANGALLWTYFVGDGLWDWSSPAVLGGNVFIGSSTGFLYSLNAATGTKNWSTLIGYKPDSPLSVGGGKVYSGTHNFDNLTPTMTALDVNTGSIAWTYDYFLNHGASGMVNSNGATLADVNGDGDLEAFFGVYTWHGVGPQLVGLRTPDGQEILSQSLGGNSTSTPAYHDGKLFIGSDSKKVFAIDANTGAIMWEFLTLAQVWSSPAVSGDGKVCFGGLDHTVYCVKESDGSLIWKYFTGSSRMASSPAISDGILYIGNENGNVYAFGPGQASIDIHPTSCPNPLNARGGGVMPAAILGSAGFDVTQIDLSSIRLEGIAPLRSAVEDVTRPIATRNTCDCTTEGGDGFDDLTLKFDTKQIVAALGTLTDKSFRQLRMTFQLLDGTPFEGTDCVRINLRK